MSVYCIEVITGAQRWPRSAELEVAFCSELLGITSGPENGYSARIAHVVDH